MNALCPLTLDGTTHLAIAGRDGFVEIRDLATGAELDFVASGGEENALCALTLEGITYLAIANEDDHSVGIWHPATSTNRYTLAGHEGRVTAICTFTADETNYLVTASRDGTVRIWDTVRAATVLTIPTRDEPLSVAYLDPLLFVGTASGLLALRLDPESLNQAPG